jgi:2',3'-cyclic-nucleotide 2'-phosphodiesterase (5'-nucleotidase family)
VKPKTDSVHEKIYASVTDRSFTIYYHTDYARKELSEEVKKDVKDWAERVIPSIKKMIQVINDEVENFNDTTLVNKITDLIAERKDELNKRDSQNDDLNDLDI